jgi:S-adenosylmethionine:tRNA ribosyltransferase-isomerase
LKEHARNRWEALLKPSARLQSGGEVRFGHDETFVDARLIERRANSWILEFSPPQPFVDVREMLPHIGEVPLLLTFARKPKKRVIKPRIRARKRREIRSIRRRRQQRIAFHAELLEALKNRGIDWVFVTLAVGAGTFAPVKSENLDDHPMHLEEFYIAPEVAARINAQKAAGGRVIAVGTTSVRTLESAVDERTFVRNAFVDETPSDENTDSFVDESVSIKTREMSVN